MESTEQPKLGAVRAYFRVNRVERQKYSENGPEQYKVFLGAQYGNRSGSLSKDYSDATPSGECWMQISPGYPAQEFFKPGKCYFLTFTEAPDPSEA